MNKMNENQLNALIVALMSYTIAYEDAAVIHSTPVFEESDEWWVSSLEDYHDTTIDRVLEDEARGTGRYFVALRVCEQYREARQRYAEVRANDVPEDNIPF